MTEKIQETEIKKTRLRLSERLKLVASFVPEGSRIADIGTDHGYVPIYLAETGKIKSALAMDVRKGPLARADEHIEEYRRDAGDAAISIETRLSNGLEKLHAGEADTVIIAGMGGELMIDIIKNSPVIGTLKEMILSPHSDKDFVRKNMMENNWKIIDETMVKDNGKYYTIMKVVPGREQNKYSPEELIYGRCLIEKQSDVFKEFLDKEYEKYTQILDVLDCNDSVIGRNIEIRRLRKLNRKARGLNG